MPYIPLSTQTGTGGQGKYVPLSSSPPTPKSSPQATPQISGPTKMWNGQQIPANVGTKNLVAHDTTTGINQFRDPGSGGIFSMDTSGKIIPGGHTTYGGVAPQAGQQRDDIIPAGLGGVNSNAQNIKYVPLSVAHQQDKVESDLAAQVKSGKLTGPEALAKSLAMKSDIANQPTFGQKVKDFFGNVVQGAKNVLGGSPTGGNYQDTFNPKPTSATQSTDPNAFTLKSWQDNGQVVPTDMPKVADTSSQRVVSVVPGAKAIYHAVVDPVIDQVKQNLAIQHDPNASYAKKSTSMVNTGVSLVNAYFTGMSTATGFSALMDVPFFKNTLGKGMSALNTGGGQTLSNLVDSVTSHLPISPADRTFIHDTTFKLGGVLAQVGLGEAAFHSSEILDAVKAKAIDHLTTSIEFAGNVADDIQRDRPVDPQVAEAYSKLSNEQRKAIYRGTMNSIPGTDPNALGKLLGLTKEEAIAIRNAKGQAVVPSTGAPAPQGNQLQLATVPNEPLATTLHPSSIVPQEPLVKENFLQNIPELARPPVESQIAPVTPKSAPGEAIVPKGDTTSPLTQEALKYKTAEEFVKAQTVFRGEGPGTGSGNYFTSDREFARNFTQSGLDTQIKESAVLPSDTYTPKELPFAGDTTQIDRAIAEAKANGFKAVSVSEGKGQPNSIFVFDKSALKTKSQLTSLWEQANKATGTESLLTEARKYLTAEEFVNNANELYRPIRPVRDAVVGETVVIRPDHPNTLWYGEKTVQQFGGTKVIGKIIKVNPASVTIEEVGGKIYKVTQDAKASMDVSSLMGKDKQYLTSLWEQAHKGVQPESKVSTREPKPRLKDFATQEEYLKAYEKFIKRDRTKPNLPEVKPKKDTSVILASGFNPGVDKFIAEEVKPAIEKAKEVAPIIAKTTKRIVEAIRGVLNADAPVRKNLGDTAYSDVIRAIHLPEAERITFDNNFNETEKWFDQFSNKQLSDFNLSRGTPSTPEAKAIQEKAQASLPPELQSPEVTKSIKQASDYVFSLATDAGLDLKYFEDYFRGVYKDPGKVADFMDYWRSTEGYIKEKVFPSIADASAYGLELKDPNPIRNIRSELEAVTKRVGLKQLRDKLEADPLSSTFAVKAEDATMPQRQEWSPIHDPVFNGMLFDPDYARLVDNLISTNKVSQNLFTKGLRQLNQLVMQVKFTGSLFHLGNELKAAVSQEAFGVADPRGYKDFITSFKPIDTTSLVYKDYVGLGGGHSYSLEAQAQNQLVVGLQRLMSGNYLGAGTRIAVGAAKIPVEVTKWMFDKFIPKLKFEKFSQDVAAEEDKLGRALTDAEKINIIKRNQNFYGEMNERLFGRSGTATSAVRLFFQAPGYGEGNFRALGRGAPDFKGNWEDPKSARFVFHSLFTTLVVALIGTRILTGKWPDVPKKVRDVRDLFKIKTTQKDGNGDTIYYDAMTYDKDYWSILGNVLTGQLSNVGTDLTTRLSGSIGGLPKAMTDTAAILEGKIVVDWKGTPIYSATDTTPQKMQKYLNYEFGSLTPISVSGFQQGRQKGQSLLASATTAVAGVRATTSEEVKHLKAIRSDLFSLQDEKKQEQIRLNTLASTNLQEAQKEAHDFNDTQMAKLKALFKEYGNPNITKSLYYLSTLNPKDKKSGGTTIDTILGQ